MSARAAALPALALALVAGVLGLQVTNGGGDFRPAPVSGPCVQRTVEPVSEGLDGLVEHVVLLALDEAACKLLLSREAFVVRLGGTGERTDAEVAAMRAGLLAAIDRLDREGSLPKVSALKDEVVEDADLPLLVEGAVRALSDDFVDRRLTTPGVLRRTVDELDIRELLDKISDSGAVRSLVRAAVVKAVVAEFAGGLPNPFG